MPIRFGTSGWRAIIADEFTFDNVRRVTEGICSYLTTNRSPQGQKLIVGHDTRFMGEAFTSIATEIAERKGFQVLRCTEPVPTPAMSHAIRVEHASGGI